MSDSPDDDLAERVAALEETLEDLQSTLQPRSGPFGLPPPPDPGDVLRFTDEYAIPTAIAVLKANVRALELVQALLRAARGAPRRDDARDRATSLGRATVDRIDRAVDEIGAALEDADLPRNAEARSLLADARALNEDVRDALAAEERDEVAGARDGNGAIDSDGRVPGTDVGTEGDARPEKSDPGGDAGSDRGVQIDVDAELSSIREELAANDDRVEDELDGGDGAVDDESDGRDDPDDDS